MNSDVTHVPVRSASPYSSMAECNRHFQQEYHGKSEISYDEVVQDQRRTKNPR